MDNLRITRINNHGIKSTFNSDERLTAQIYSQGKKERSRRWGELTQAMLMNPSQENWKKIETFIGEIRAEFSEQQENALNEILQIGKRPLTSSNPEDQRRIIREIVNAQPGNTGLFVLHLKEISKQLLTLKSDLQWQEKEVKGKEVEKGVMNRLERLIQESNIFVFLPGSVTKNIDEVFASAHQEQPESNKRTTIPLITKEDLFNTATEWMLDPRTVVTQVKMNE